jgi:hypothetical protein
MQTKYVFKIFNKVNNRLTSLYDVWPITYRRNQWNKAPKGTGLFVYTEDDYLKELLNGLELWLCEYRGLRKDYRDFFNIYCSGRNLSLEKLQLKYKNSYPTKEYTHLVDSIKPVEKIDFRINNFENRDIIVNNLLKILKNKNLTNSNSQV